MVDKPLIMSLAKDHMLIRSQSTGGGKSTGGSISTGGDMSTGGLLSGFLDRAQNDAETQPKLEALDGEQLSARFNSTGEQAHPDFRERGF